MQKEKYAYIVKSHILAFLYYYLKVICKMKIQSAFSAAFKENTLESFSTLYHNTVNKC